MSLPHLADFQGPQAEHHNSACLHLDKTILFPIFLMWQKKPKAPSPPVQVAHRAPSKPVLLHVAGAE